MQLATRRQSRRIQAKGRTELDRREPRRYLYSDEKLHFTFATSCHGPIDSGADLGVVHAYTLRSDGPYWLCARLSNSH